MGPSPKRPATSAAVCAMAKRYPHEHSRTAAMTGVVQKLTGTDDGPRTVLVAT